MPSTASRTPRDVFTVFQDALDARDFATALACYAEDVRVSQPLARPEPATLDGRAALAEHFRRVRELPVVLGAVDRVVHETADPEVIVVEYTYDARNRATGRHVRFANVVVARVRDGRITESRDYHDPSALAELLGE
ncbi:nuclear transport factor 2 family protein [Yinghuangia sp. ASG 101]|uniref:nuclear transport factor 2 family protein n=1 Tax=Yinghuangia sp. ASG 101 TaxID=2896848 RepID=UPI001E5E38BF|nr:nuclear transport factor 2 family protein [Yinghuangia sp. ASG 101]UGQ13678.1 nuclear transport factor 2 family protein [Yinghuangia sp. ASG 101]